jgi:hypothetical protein
VKAHKMRVAAIFAACAGMFLATAAAPRVNAQDESTPPYLNPALPPDARARDLVGRLTLEEKASQLVNQARAIPRLKVPSYDWWSEALHGVIADGVTEFPEPIGLGATFDPDAIHNMAVVIGTEGRIKHMQAVKANGGYSNIFQGSTSGRRTSTSFAIPAGAAARRPMARTPTSPRAWALPLSLACKATIRSIIALSPRPSTTRCTAVRSQRGTSRTWT